MILQVPHPFEYFAQSQMSSAQRLFVASRIYSFAPVKNLLKRRTRERLLQEIPFERHVGLVGTPAGEEVGTRVVFDVINSEKFKQILRLA